MSSEKVSSTVEKIAGIIQETAVEIAWKQWAGLGAGAVTAPLGRAGSIIDLEGLLLLSLAFQESERRLADFLAWWAKVGAGLLSVQRTKTMAGDFPGSVAVGLAGFARLAVDGGDRRWRGQACDEPPAWGTRRLKGTETPRLTAASTLMARLRAGFGVNAKADALCFLLGTGGQATTVQDIAGAIRYSTVAVRNAMKDMVLGRLIHETPGQPVRFYVHTEPWVDLLKLRESGGLVSLEWVHWHPVFAFLAHARVLFEQMRTEAPSAYVLSSRARDVVEEFGGAFSKNRIPVPRASDFQGAEYLEGFLETLEALRTWAVARG